MIAVASDRWVGVDFVCVYHRPMWRLGLNVLVRFSGFRPLAEA